MCGRFALGYPKKVLEETYGMTVPEEYRPSYNVAPGQDVLVFRHDGGALMRWGFLPPWQRDESDRRPMINARSETVFDTVSFRKAVRTSRCLVPSQGFYEWKRSGKTRQPNCIRVDGEGPTSLGGIFAEWIDPASGEAVETMAVLTCPPNEVVAAIHDRMPVIVPESAWAAWLEPLRTVPEDIAPMLAPHPADGMRAWPVSHRVNNVINRDSALMRPVEISRQGRLF